MDDNKARVFYCCIAMGTMTSGEITILTVQGLHILTNAYMHYKEHIFNSDCCGGKGCSLNASSKTDQNAPLDVPDVIVPANKS